MPTRRNAEWEGIRGTEKRRGLAICDCRMGGEPRSHVATKPRSDRGMGVVEFRLKRGGASGIRSGARAGNRGQRCRRVAACGAPVQRTWGVIGRGGVAGRSGENELRVTNYELRNAGERQDAENSKRRVGGNQGTEGRRRGGQTEVGGGGRPRPRRAFQARMGNWIAREPWASLRCAHGYFRGAFQRGRTAIVDWPFRPAVVWRVFTHEVDADPETGVPRLRSSRISRSRTIVIEYGRFSRS
jgi:hypothetical protein